MQRLQKREDWRTMRVKMQLSGIKDLDLISLHYNKEFNLPREMRLALKAYAEGKECVIALPKQDNRAKYALNAVQINIPLHSEDDKVVTLLKSLKNGCRSAAIKAIFRNCLQEPCIFAFLEDGSEIARAAPKKLAKTAQPIFNSLPEKVEIPEENEDDFDIFSDGFITNL